MCCACACCACGSPGGRSRFPPPRGSGRVCEGAAFPAAKKAELGEIAERGPQRSEAPLVAAWGVQVPAPLEGVSEAPAHPRLLAGAAGEVSGCGYLLWRFPLAGQDDGSPRPSRQASRRSARKGGCAFRPAAGSLERVDRYLHPRSRGAEGADRPASSAGGSTRRRRSGVDYALDRDPTASKQHRSSA